MAHITNRPALGSFNRYEWYHRPDVLVQARPVAARCSLHAVSGFVRIEFAAMRGPRQAWAGRVFWIQAMKCGSARGKKNRPETQFQTTTSPLVVQNPID